MKITGHATSHVFRRYDLGDVDALRQRLSTARTKVASLASLRDNAKLRAARTPTVDSCTATAQHALAAAGDVQ